MKYNRYMESHFSGCMRLAQTKDLVRHRNVSLYLIPGEFNVVGVSDGTDAWIAPVVADPFSVRIQQIMDDVKAGKFVAPKNDQRRRLNKPQMELPLEQPKPQRRRLNVR